MALNSFAVRMVSASPEDRRPERLRAEAVSLFSRLCKARCANHASKSERYSRTALFVEEPTGRRTGNPKSLSQRCTVLTPLPVYAAMSFQELSTVG